MSVGSNKTQIIPSPFADVANASHTPHPTPTPTLSHPHSHIHTTLSNDPLSTFENLTTSHRFNHFTTPMEKGPAIAAKLKGPGPAKYRLPGTCGNENHDVTRKKMPAFSFGKRFNTKYESCSPGPSYMVPQFVTRTGRNSAPAYSLYGRQPERKGEKTPAPGNYSPEKFPIPNDKRAPVYSFGCRLQPPRGEVTPAPNAYKLPSLIGSQSVANPSAPAHSIRGRPKIGAYYEDLQKTPGPGTYQICDLNKYLKRGPAYSVKGRHEVRDKCIVPGPGAFYPEEVYINKKTAPSFSFGVRHTEYMTLMNDDYGPPPESPKIT